MRLLACVILTACLCLGATGCAMFSGKKSGAETDRSASTTPPLRERLFGERPKKENHSNPAQPTDKTDPILGGSSSRQAPENIAAAIAKANGNQGAILAGRVIDPYDHALGNAFVRSVSMEEKDAANGVDVAVNPEGYFTIQGLKAGLQYKLIARAKTGERMLAGITYTAAPNIRVLIQVREDFASADIPPLPGNPAFTGGQPGGQAGAQPSGQGGGQSGGQAGAPPSGQAGTQPSGQAGSQPSGQAGAQPGGQAGGLPGGQAGGQPDGENKQPPPKLPGATETSSSQGWTPVNGQPGKTIQASAPSSLGMDRSAQEPDLPVQVRVPMPQQVAGIMPNPGWTPAIGEPNRNWPPTLEIPGPRGKSAVEMAKPMPVSTPPAGEPPPPMFPGVSSTAPVAPASPDVPGVSAARVPSCVLVGKQLVNFALNDINGEPFEFKSQKRGKVVLIDFWATYCVPCQKTIPQLRSLQNRYGSQGLEVIGVAYETGGTTQEQAHRVNAVSQRQQVNYRQLLGAGPQCPVRAQLNIQLVPTLILVDEGGWILWRHEGAPDRGTLDELDRRIQRALSVKAS